MRRLLLVLALFPAAVFAQNALPANPGLTSDNSTLPAGIHTYGPNGSLDQSLQPSAQTLRAAPATIPNGQGKLRDEGQAFAPATGQTAAEQGYVSANTTPSAQAQADYAAFHTARQLGEQVRQPGPWNPVAKDHTAQGWLGNWVYTLDRAGVPHAKVQFEAERLSRADFEAWANRQLITLRTCQ